MNEIKFYTNIGRAQQLMENLNSELFFDDLSKHNPEWTSIYEEEDEKLDTLRRRLMVVKDRLDDIKFLLEIEMCEE